MKRTLSLCLVALLIVGSTLMLCACGPSAEVVFTGSYQPRQTMGAEAVEFELTLYSDGTLKLTPGMMLTLDDTDTTKIISDAPATGTWTKKADETIVMTITAAGDNSFSLEYTVEKIDGYYEFDMMLDLMGRKRPIVMTSN